MCGKSSRQRLCRRLCGLGLPVCLGPSRGDTVMTFRHCRARLRPCARLGPRYVAADRRRWCSCSSSTAVLRLGSVNLYDRKRTRDAEASPVTGAGFRRAHARRAARGPRADACLPARARRGARSGDDIEISLRCPTRPCGRGVAQSRRGSCHRLPPGRPDQDRHDRCA